MTGVNAERTGINTEGRRAPGTGDTLVGLAIFLAINFLVAAIYFHVINPQNISFVATTADFQ